MIRRPPRSTQSRSSAASDVYKRQHVPRRADHEDPWLGRDAVGVRRLDRHEVPVLEHRLEATVRPAELVGLHVDAADRVGLDRRLDHVAVSYTHLTLPTIYSV